MSDVPFMLHEGPCQETLTPIIEAVEAEQEDEESLQVLANELECPKYCTQEWNPVCGRLMSSATSYFYTGKDALCGVYAIFVSRFYEKFP